MTENKCDLISREALKEAFEDCTGECACCVHNTNDFEYCGLIDNAPTVYPICEDKACKYRANERPQKTGEWIAIKLPITEEEGDIKIICSNCKDEFIGQNDLETWIKVYHYCPSCGAKMRGK